MLSGSVCVGLVSVLLTLYTVPAAAKPTELTVAGSTVQSSALKASIVYDGSPRVEEFESAIRNSPGIS